MKIISNFKDYYDYLQGVYGIDEKIVFVRKKENFTSDHDFRIISPRNLQEFIEFSKIDDKIIFTFAFCNQLHLVFWNKKDKTLMFDEEAKECILKIDKYLTMRLQGNFPRFTDLNVRLNEPVLLSRGIVFDEEEEFFPVSMQEWGLNKCITAHDAYVSLSTWLSKEKVFDDQRTDEQKIIGHGFDKVYSFRNKR